MLPTSCACVGSAAFADAQDTAEKLFSGWAFVDVEAIAHHGGQWWCSSSQGDPTERLYHYDGAYLMRSGEELVPMSENKAAPHFAEG